MGGLRHILICFSLSPCNGEAGFIPTLQMGLSNWATVTQPRTEDLASHSSRPLADSLYAGACHTRGPCQSHQGSLSVIPGVPMGQTRGPCWSDQGSLSVIPGSLWVRLGFPVGYTRGPCWLHQGSLSLRPGVPISQTRGPCQLHQGSLSVNQGPCQSDQGSLRALWPQL